MAGGWIKLHRKIEDHWIWQDAEYLRAWIDLLLMATRGEQKFLSKGELVVLQAGQLVTSINILKDRWGWSKNKVVHFLGMLEHDKMVTRKGTQKGTLITVVNWALYQSRQYAEGYTERYAEGTAEGYAEGQTEGSLTRNIKNNKEGGEFPRLPGETEDEWITRYMVGKYGEEYLK